MVERSFGLWFNGFIYLHVSDARVVDFLWRKGGEVFFTTENTEGAENRKERRLFQNDGSVRLKFNITGFEKG